MAGRCDKSAAYTAGRCDKSAAYTTGRCDKSDAYGWKVRERCVLNAKKAKVNIIIDEVVVVN